MELTGNHTLTAEWSGTRSKALPISWEDMVIRRIEGNTNVGLLERSDIVGTVSYH